MTAAIADLITALAAAGDPQKASGLRRFFKTAPGEYGEGDVFLGLTVPATRRIVKAYLDLPLSEVRMLLASDIHEHRFAGLIILVARAAQQPEEIANFYLEAVRAGRVNNWDLVDCSAEFILGAYLLDRPRAVLFELAASSSLWERRVSVISTFAFIKHGDATTTLEIASILLPDRADLIQKAVGWMLREIGKRVDPALLVAFLDDHAAQLGRTALSYACEHLTVEQRMHYRAQR